MSYSFNVRGPSKAAVLPLIGAEFDKIEANQPVHAHDRAQAIDAAVAVLNLVQEPGDGLELSVSVNGYLQWSDADPAAGDFTGASVGVSVGMLAKKSTDGATG